MMQRSPSFLDGLTAAAEHAQAAEARYRREADKQIRQLAMDRAFAFRRLNLMQTIASAVADAKRQEMAISIATAALCTKLGWSSDSEARAAVLSKFATVAQAVYADLASNDTQPTRSGALKALADFERWYAQAHPSEFWVLFENEMRETPVVDF